MENIIFNELIFRGLSVDVGMVRHDETIQGRVTRKQLEVDFVANRGSQRYYIQSAYAIPDKEKLEQEQRSLRAIPDSFKKIILVDTPSPVWRSDAGITIMNLQDFLLNPKSLDA